jgi:hypothetical protein
MPQNQRFIKGTTMIFNFSKGKSIVTVETNCDVFSSVSVRLTRYSLKYNKHIITSLWPYYFKSRDLEGALKSLKVTELLVKKILKKGYEFKGVS